jgi:hypothetical protein
MPKFEKGRKHTGGRVKGALLVRAKELTVWTREMFEDPRYQMSVRQRLLKGRLPPQVECKLLACAYGEPARDVTLHANLRGLVSIVHEHIAAQPQPVLDVPALPAPDDCMTMHETVVSRQIMQPASMQPGSETSQVVEDEGVSDS